MYVDYSPSPSLAPTNGGGQGIDEMTSFIDFTEWLERNRADFLVPSTPCPDCKSTGYVTCRCCHSDLVCDKCDGTGQIEMDGGQLSLDINAAKLAYNEARQKDIDRLKAWA